jgi:flagellar protein FlgJ
LQVKDLLAKRADEESMRQAQRTFQSRLAGATTMQPTMQGVLNTQSNIDPAMLEGMSAQEVIGMAPKTQQVTDQAAADRAVMDYLRVASPVEYAKLVARGEPKGETFRPITEAERKALNLPAEIAYQVSSTGKISQVGQGPLVKNIVGGEQSEFGKQADREQAQIFSEIKKSGQKAIGTLRDVTRLGSILERSPGGWEAGIKLAAGNFGIKSEGLTDLQTAEAIINRLVPQQRPPGTGQMSDADLDLFKKSLPRIINQPGGNKAIISYLKGINEYLIKEGEIASLVLNRKITPIEADQRLMALQNPLEEFKNSAAGGLPPGVTVTPIGR